MPPTLDLLAVGTFRLLGEIPTAFLVILAVLLVVVFIIRLIIRIRKKTIAAWSQAAEDLGINFNRPGTFGSYLMEGTVAGFHVKVHTYTQSSGENSKTYNQFAVRFPQSLEMGLKLSREVKFFSSIAKALGGQDIVTGDESFDSTFVIKGDNPQAIQEFLTEERKQQIQELQTTHKGMVVTDTELSWTRGGVVRKTEDLVGHVTELTRVAFVLAGHLAKLPAAQ
jgi:hypothetical protein